MNRKELLIDIKNAYSPTDGITKEELKNIRPYIDGEFLLCTNIKRLLALFPILYLIFFLEGLSYINDSLDVQIEVSALIIFICVITLIGNHFCLKSWKSGWKKLNIHIKSIKRTYIIYWWVLCFSLILLSFYELGKHQHGILFIFTCLIVFIVPLSDGLNLIRRIVGSIIVYACIAAYITRNNLHFVRSPIEIRISMFYISLFIITVCAFAQKSQYHRFEVNMYVYYLANLDNLTKCYNRKGAQLHFERFYANAINKCGIIMLDIDYFKKYNDTMGHDAGDACLKIVGNTIRDIALKYNALPIRHGGEEFVVICSASTPSNKVVDIAEEIRSRIEKNSIKSPDSVETENITVSIGISYQSFQEKQSYDSYLKEADEALYHSKQTGRNKITVYPLKEKKAKIV